MAKHDTARQLGFARLRKSHEFVAVAGPTVYIATSASTL